MENGIKTVLLISLFFGIMSFNIEANNEGISLIEDNNNTPKSNKQIEGKKENNLGTLIEKKDKIIKNIKNLKVENNITQSSKDTSIVNTDGNTSGDLSNRKAKKIELLYLDLNRPDSRKNINFHNKMIDTDTNKVKAELLDHYDKSYNFEDKFVGDR